MCFIEPALIQFDDVQADNESHSQDAEDDISFLEKNTHPWDEIILRWNCSFIRRQLMLNELTDIEIYLKRFPALSSNKGYELVNKN